MRRRLRIISACRPSAPGRRTSLPAHSKRRWRQRGRPSSRRWSTPRTTPRRCTIELPRMKAIRIHANGGPEVMRWEDADLPPPAAGEVRIRHTAIAFNFSDVNVRRGGFYIAKPASFPLILGNEAAGIVADVGPGVTEVRPGERVAYVGTGGPFYEATGSYAEERNVPASCLIRLPDGISEPQAAALLLKGLTASMVINRVFKPKPGDAI